MQTKSELLEYLIQNQISEEVTATVMGFILRLEQQHALELEDNLDRSGHWLLHNRNPQDGL
jgi:hypothetical protein